MGNGDRIKSDLEFEQLINGMEDRPLLEFIAREVHDHGRRLRKVEARSKRMMAVFGGIGTALGGGALLVVEYFKTRGT